MPDLPYDPPGPPTEHEKNLALRLFAVGLFIVGLAIVFEGYLQ